MEIGEQDMGIPDETEREAEIVDMRELEEALVDVTEQDDMQSSHNARIDDNSGNSDGSDDTHVTVLSDIDLEIVVGAIDLANISQLDGTVDSSSEDEEGVAGSSDDQIMQRLNRSRSGNNLDYTRVHSFCPQSTLDRLTDIMTCSRRTDTVDGLWS